MSLKEDDLVKLLEDTALAFYVGGRLIPASPLAFEEACVGDVARIMTEFFAKKIVVGEDGEIDRESIQKALDELHYLTDTANRIVMAIHKETGIMPTL